MAHSRLEKIGTIYSRARGLIQSQAVKWEDRPLWYDVYEKFPPKEEPVFDRPAPNIPVKQIFYKEDIVRAQFHKKNKSIGAVNLLNNRNKSLAQRFIQCYETLDKQYEGAADSEKLYQEALEMLQRDSSNQSEQYENMSLKSAFKEAQNKDMNINVKDIFKE